MANEKRLIDANALWIKVHHRREDAFRHADHIKCRFVTEIENDIEDATTVDAVEVVHGRWIPIIDEPTPLRKMPMLSGYKCSVCGRYEVEEEPYCNCGAKMDGDGNA